MKRFLCTLLAGLSLLALCGCRSAFEREYYYEAPYSGDIGMRSDTATEIRNYSMLKTALTNMITNHTEKGEFRFSNYNGNLSEDLAAACFEIKSEHPLGAYAVETLSYDTSYVVSYYMANIYISYKRSAEELRSIIYTSTLADFEDSIRGAVNGFVPELVIRCFSADVNEEYILRLVKRHYYDHPAATMEEPAAEVTAYPAEGANRIFDIRFTYEIMPQSRGPMARTLEERLRTAAAEMTETEMPKLALESALYLGQRCAWRGIGPSTDTAYGAFVSRNADSKGLALAYRILCDALGIECTVVEGSYGSMETQAHFWNIIALDGDYYHVDVSGIAEDPAASFLLSDDALWGRCIWETADYPACGGPLTYAEVAGIPEPGEEAPDAEADGEEQQTSAGQPAPSAQEDTEPPQESPGPVDEPGTEEHPETGEEPGTEEHPETEAPPETGEEPGTEDDPETEADPNPEDAPEAPPAEEPPQESENEQPEEQGEERGETENGEKIP